MCRMFMISHKISSQAVKIKLRPQTTVAVLPYTIEVEFYDQVDLYHRGVEINYPIFEFWGFFSKNLPHC